MNSLLKVIFLITAIGSSLTINSIAIHSANLPTEPVIDGYRKWTRANQQTVQMEAAVAALCAPAAPVKANPGVKPNPSPHKDKFINVYVNSIGQHALTLERSPRYPQGSIIVKEKLASADSTTPELLTVMIKRERGYNPASNDWEFLVVSGDTKTVLERGKLENCTACHASQRGSDFIFRNYLTPGDWQRMK
jgi:hypothetical protein